MIDQGTKIHSLYGYPVSHSLSPLIFNKTFEKQDLNRTYIPFTVKPDDLAGAVDAARALGFEGFNVTMPHKTAIVPLLDRLEGPAEKIGAVNTVAQTGTGLVGHNTDGEGGLRAIKAHGLNTRGRTVLVIGAGGAAKALVHSLSREANRIIVLNRTLRKARNVARVADGKAAISYSKLTRVNLRKFLSNTDLIVNATPVQTHRLLDLMSLPQTSLPPDGWLFDLAYDKRPTQLAAGIRCINPLEMLVQQAALSYEIWLREPAPLKLMRSILAHHNGRG